MGMGLGGGGLKGSFQTQQGIEFFSTALEAGFEDKIFKNLSDEPPGPHHIISTVY